MAEKARTEISKEVLDAVRWLAEAQGRTESEVLDEAALRYLRFLTYWQTVERSAGEREQGYWRILSSHGGDTVAEWRTARGDFLALLDRMSSRFDLDDEEALRIAVEEQKAFRQERADRERDREWRA
jgi:hypothetical protein